MTKPNQQSRTMKPVSQTRPKVSRRRWLYLALAGAGIGGGGLYYAATAWRHNIPEYGYEIVNRYPHDPLAFTQGLIYHNGFLYEGTGGTPENQRESSLRKVDLQSGDILQIERLPDPMIFGEGITLWNNTIIQLTWRHLTAYRYDVNTFERIDPPFRYLGQGWGLTHNGEHLIMSNGTETLTFRDPNTFETVREVEVTANGYPLPRLNELEYINGEIYANIWYSDDIARISPITGQVLSFINLSGLRSQVAESDRDSVLNGIAYDQAGKRLFVTGKNWPELFEIRVVE